MPTVHGEKSTISGILMTKAAWPGMTQKLVSNGLISSANIKAHPVQKDINWTMAHH